CDAFDAARASVPKKIDGWSAAASANGGTIRIDLKGPAGAKPSTPNIQVFPVEARIVDASADASVAPTVNGFVIEVARDKHAAALPDRLGLVLVADGGWDSAGSVQALQVEATTTTGAQQPVTASAAPETAPNDHAPSPVERASGAAVASK